MGRRASEDDEFVSSEVEMTADSPPLTEPEVIPCVFLTGGAIEAGESTVRFVGWVQLPMLGGETEERRIQVRFAMPVDNATALYRALGSELARVNRARH